MDLSLVRARTRIRKCRSQDDISFEEIILLDKVQKKIPISVEDANRLRRKGFIEGRRPSYVISTSLAKTTENNTTKISAKINKGFDDNYYQDLILKYLKNYGFATTADLHKLLYTKLPDVLTDTQKYNKTHNLIKKLVTSKKIVNTGTTRKTNYVLITECEQQKFT